MLNSLFGKKPTVQAMAEVLEDGRAKGNAEMGKRKYNDYSGPVPSVEIAVRVQPQNEPPFAAQMKAGITHTYLLKVGVLVKVNYDPGKKERVTLEDDAQAIVARNPLLTPKQP